MDERTLTIIHAGGGSETYTLKGYGSEPFSVINEMDVDGSEVFVDRTEQPDIRTLVVDGSDITIDRSKGDDIRVITIDGVPITIDRSDEIDELEGLVMKLLSFAESDVEVRDKTSYGNRAVLKSGRFLTTDGVNDIGINADLGAPYVASASYYFKGLVRTARATVGCQITNGLSGLCTVSGLSGDASVWQEFTSSTNIFTAIPNRVAVGFYNSASSDPADWADIELWRDDNGTQTKICSWLLNEHTDETVDGLDGKTCIGRKPDGTAVISQHVGCTAGTQEGIPLEFAGLGAYGDYQCFNGVDTQINLPTVTSTGDFWVEFDLFYVRNGELVTNILYFSSLERLFIRETDRIRFEIDNQQFNYSDLSLIENAFNSVRFERIGDQGTLTINGESQTLTVLTSTWRFNEIGRVSGAGHLKGFFVNFQSSNGPSYLGYGPTPWKDLNGSNDGTPIGTFATVAQLRTTPPQVLGMNFNQYRYFNGNESITGSLAFSSATDAYIQFEVYVTDSTPASNQRLFSQGSDVAGNNFNATLQTTGNIVFSVGGNTSGLQSLAVAFQGQGLYRFELNGGTQLRVLFNGVEIDSATIPATTLLTSSRGFAIGSQRATTTSYFTGLISSVNLNGQIAYDGYGPTPWADTIGSNDGTESGTFENVLVPASLSNSSLDALGNAMDLRERDEFNADGSGSAVVPYDDSLDLTTEATWVFKGNFSTDNSVDKPILSKWRTGNLSWLFFISASDATGTVTIRFSSTLTGGGPRYTFSPQNTDSVIAVVYTGGKPVVYEDGQEIAVTTVSGSDVSSLTVSTSDILILRNEASGAISDLAAGDFKIYNRALTAEEIQTL